MGMGVLACGERCVCLCVCACTCLFTCILVCADRQALYTAVAAKERKKGGGVGEEKGLSLQTWPGARQYRSQHNGQP